MMRFSVHRATAGWLALLLLMFVTGLFPRPLRAEDPAPPAGTPATAPLTAPASAPAPAIAPDATPTITPSATPAITPLTAPATVPAAVAATAPAAITAAWQMPRPGPTEAVISKIVGQLMPRVHYQRLPMDAELSVKFFDAYFDRLDHDRTFFLATDLEEFGKEKTALCDMVLQGNWISPTLFMPD